MSYPKPLPIQNIQFDADRHGFMCALSRRESSSNLLLPHSDEINKNAAWNKNSIGFVGYFQFGEDALIDCGYYNPRIKNTDKYRSNNWTGFEVVVSQLSDIVSNTSIKFIFTINTPSGRKIF